MRDKQFFLWTSIFFNQFLQLWTLLQIKLKLQSTKNVMPYAKVSSVTDYDDPYLDVRR